MPSVKMVGNMIELNRPIAITLHIATAPLAEHRGRQQRDGDQREQAAAGKRGSNAPQQRRADEAADHRAAPVVRHIAGRRAGIDAPMRGSAM